MSSVTSVTSQSWVNESNSSDRVPKQTLDQDDFLNLLVAQMQNQDPMNPQSNEESIAQLAQFSELEYSKSLDTEIKAMRKDQQFEQATNLIGRSVDLLGSDGAQIEGRVESVEVADGSPQLVIDNQRYGVESVLRVNL